MKLDDAAGGDRPMITRRRLLAGGAMAGAAAALAACAGNGPSAAAQSLAASQDPAASAAAVELAQSATLAFSATGVSSAIPPSLPPDQDTSMRLENARRGDRHWDDRRIAGGVQAYLAKASVGPGEAIGLRASGSGVVSVEWYRLGWYGGAGARLLRVDHNVRLRRQQPAVTNHVTGLVEARWSPVLETHAPTGVKSGMLLAVVRGPGGKVVANVPVVLRPDPADPMRAPVLFVSAASTWQAYNQWGGLDFYGNRTHVPVTATQGRWAAQVSFDRPYQLDGGAMYLRRWELGFIRWMERAGRDVEYIADLDLERYPDLAGGRRLIVMAGHPEYWSRPMRERLEAAVASGTNVAFLTANEVYWQTRLEDGPAGPKTRITCYKRGADDPLHTTQPALTTCEWRESPVSEPEATLIGQMYGAVVRQVSDWIVTGERHWLYEGTGLRDGDAIANLVGQEFDTFFPEFAQPGTMLLANSPVDAVVGRPHGPTRGVAVPNHNATIYTAQSGATVFAAGTFQWSWAIDAYGNRTYRGVQTPLDPRVSRMTRNLFDRPGDGPLAG